MAVTLEDIRLTFPGPQGDVPVLDLPRLQIADGEQVCVVGPSGSGKTSLLHVIAGIVAPTAGRVLHGEVDITALTEPARDRFRAQHIGYVFQTFNLLGALSSLENVALALTLAGRPTREANARARQLLESMGLGHRLHARPDTLSSGEQQRVAVARAVVKRPPLVLADEPTAALDDRAADRALGVLRQAAHEAGSALVIVTHDARARGTGRVVELGAPA
jgi:ABC-type lipoprotein export system ATPase subunit